EIDMVINIGWLKDKKYEALEDEIRQIHQARSGRILKVIIETCLLTEEEKIKMCEIVTKAGAEFIKTSTGFSTGGATFADVELMRKHVGKDVKVIAAGGISSFDDAEEFIRLGAERLGTSRLVKSMKDSPDAEKGDQGGDGVSTHMMVELVGYMGSILVLINLYYLIRLRKSDRN